MDERLDTNNWSEVFGERGEYCEPENAMCPVAVPGDDCSTAPFTREDVAEVLHIHEEGDCWAEWCGCVVVRLKDGRFAALSGWCDSSGWG